RGQLDGGTYVGYVLAVGDHGDRFAMLGSADGVLPDCGLPPDSVQLIRRATDRLLAHALRVRRGVRVDGAGGGPCGSASGARRAAARSSRSLAAAAGGAGRGGRGTPLLDMPRRPRGCRRPTGGWPGGGAGGWERGG